MPREPIILRKQAIFPENKTGTSGSYSPGLSVGEWVFVSGQGPIGRDPNEIVGSDIVEQTTVTLNNVKDLLRLAGCSMNDCVKVTVHLTNMEDFDKMNAVYQTYFAQPFPARTTVQSGLWKNILIEIDVIALRNAGSC